MIKRLLPLALFGGALLMVVSSEGLAGNIIWLLLFFALFVLSVFGISEVDDETYRKKK